MSCGNDLRGDVRSHGYLECEKGTRHATGLAGYSRRGMAEMLILVVKIAGRCEIFRGSGQTSGSSIRPAR